MFVKCIIGFNEALSMKTKISMNIIKRGPPKVLGLTRFGLAEVPL